MRDYTLDIAQREIGQLPLSIGTSMAIEVFTDRPDPEREGRLLPKPKPPEQLWVNVRTVFRNLYNAMNPDLRKLVLPDHFVPTLVNEIEMIQSIVSERTLGLTEVVFYHCTYKDLATRFPKAMHKPLNTELQKIYFAMEQSACEDALTKLHGQVAIKQYVSKIQGLSKASWILTHIPVDLVSTQFFSKLTLLESHTGKLKERLDWNTKLTGGEKVSHLPFMAFTMQVFGDGGLYFSPMPIKIKNEVLALAEKYRWTPATSLDKVRFSIQSMNDHFGRTWLLSIAR